jgi:hypothetical protein
MLLWGWPASGELEAARDGARVCRWARWSVCGVLRLVLVVLLSCVCCVVLLLVCAGVRMRVHVGGSVWCWFGLFDCLWWLCCSRIFGVTHMLLLLAGVVPGREQ